MPSCTNCGVWAGEEHWRTLCRVCYVKSPQAKASYTKLKNEVEYLKRRCAELEGRQTQNNVGGRFQLDKPMVQRLIVLCHPDKHLGSELSTKVTQYLLHIREKL